MGDNPNYCPRPQPYQMLRTALPPGMLGFLVECKPGSLIDIPCSATRADRCTTGCTVDQAFIPIQISWEREVMASGRIAPGGNRYWSTSFPAKLQDPRAMAALRFLSARSAQAFCDIWAKDTTRSMADVMAAGQWVTKVGLIGVPVQPKSDETAAAFVARGGYLLDLRPAFSPILNGTAWQKQGATIYPWLAGTNIRTVELWGSYDFVAEQINLTLRIVYSGQWDRAANAVGKAISSAGSSFCGQLAKNAGYAATVATVFPATAPYMAAYSGALTLCSISQVTPVPCIPREPDPMDYVAQIARATWAVTAPPAGQAPSPKRPPSAANSIITAGLDTLTSRSYPQGTIAYRAASSPGYDIAVPTTGPRYQVVTRNAPSLPAGVRVVERKEWEAATMPLIQRRSFQIGAGVVTVLGAVAAAAVVVARRP